MNHFMIDNMDYVNEFPTMEKKKEQIWSGFPNISGEVSTHFNDT